MTKVRIYYDLRGEKNMFDIFIGEPNPKNHPLQNQARYVSIRLGGIIKNEVMEGFGKLKTFAEKYDINFEELCQYRLPMYENISKAYIFSDKFLETIEKNKDELFSIDVYGEIII